MTTPTRFLVSYAWKQFVIFLPIGQMRLYADKIRPVRLEDGAVVMQSNDKEALAWAEARWTSTLERQFLKPVRWELI